MELGDLRMERWCGMVGEGRGVMCRESDQRCFSSTSARRAEHPNLARVKRNSIAPKSNLDGTCLTLRSNLAPTPSKQYQGWSS